jgi:cytochrome c553
MTSKINILFVIFASAAVIASCTKTETKISSTNSSKSHNMGKNCMECHKSGGKGEGWFTAAGTVYNSNLSSTNPNGFVELYTQANGAGTLVKRIAVDGLGNFYTTETIDFSTGLYPVVVSSTGNKMYMGSSITTGACASCHGSSQDKIWVSN